EDLDSLINAAAFGGLKLKEEGMPKGLREITLQQVVNCLEDNQEGLSAEAVAEVVGLARVTARRYLEYLEKIGQVQLLSKYGAVGRPINRYRIRKN
ncbi:MAG TPA: helix-turn-helix domain-containing protein, partial [Verrucomicrobiae bacterium]|nr:helix-turn-helix domain-containing protein [Verrucomicrobiae bacterium]